MESPDIVIQRTNTSRKVKHIASTSEIITKKRGRPKNVVKSDIKIIQGPITVSFS